MSQKNLSRPSQYTRKKIQNFSYGLTDQIGKGYSSQVYRGRNDDADLQVAVKVIDMKMLKSQINKQLLSSEIEILKRMKNYPNILKLYQVYTTKNNTYIITELCEGDLTKRIKNKLSELDAIKLMKEILYGYSFILKQSIVHRDLKPANILLTTQNVLKIADFGFAVDAEEVSKPNKYNVGSPLYMAPQSLKKNQYSFKTDVWAIGVIFFQMLTAQTPWRAKSQKQLIKKIQQQKIQTILLKKDFSHTAKEFLMRTLTIDKNLRITPEDMINFHLGVEESIPPILTQKKINISIKYQSIPSEIATPNKSSEKKKMFNFVENSQSLNQFNNTTNKSQQKPKNNAKSIQQCVNVNNFTLENIRSKPQKKQEVKKQSEKIIKDIKKEQKKNISKILIAEVHFCRFLFKLLLRIKQSLSYGILCCEKYTQQVFSIFKSYAKLIKYKLYQVLEFKNINFLKLNEDTYFQYKQTSDFKKLFKISKEYLQRYSKQLFQHWSFQVDLTQCDWKEVYDPTTTKQFLYFFKNKIQSSINQLGFLAKNKCQYSKDQQDNNHQQLNQWVQKYSKDIVILDYLMTSKQLLDILRDNPYDYERFAKKSRIEQIVEGTTAKIDYQLYQKIFERANLLLNGQLKNNIQKVDKRCR